MWPSLPLIVTVRVPSALGATTNGPASTVVSDFPFAGFVYVRWKSTACVTSLPLEKTVSRSPPSVWIRNGNAHAFGPAGNVDVRSKRVIVVTGWSAAAVGASAASAAATTASASADDLILICPPVRSVLPDDAD